MPVKSRLYEILARDRVWSAYAICDLEEPMFAQCEWHVNGDVLLLVFRGLNPPLLFAMGSGRKLDSLIARLREPRVWVNYTASQEPSFRRYFDVTDEHLYLRMHLEALRARPGPALPLNRKHLGDLERLYVGGAAPIFSLSQLDTGYFRGIEVNGELIAAAGVHVLSRTYSVATVGNVVTHPNHRGHGFAKACASAVVSGLVADGFQTIALNVESGNHAAVGVYERIGFRTRCEFSDGRALRR